MRSRPGLVGSLTLELVIDAQERAERDFLDAVTASDDADRADGIAEGLALAVELLGGGGAGEVRRRATERIEAARRADDLERERSRVALARLRASMRAS